VQKSYQQLVREAKAAVRNTSPDELRRRLEGGEPLVLIDVREPQEWSQGVLPNANRIPRGVLEGQVEGRLPRDATVVLYCAAGNRSALAAKSLVEMGFDKVENLEGGFGAWSRAGYPLEPSS
jgi:rhodanese-related sulfurtransferase